MHNTRDVTAWKVRKNLKLKRSKRAMSSRLDPIELSTLDSFRVRLFNLVRWRQHNMRRDLEHSIPSNNNRWMAPPSTLCLWRHSDHEEMHMVSQRLHNNNNRTSNSNRLNNNIDSYSNQLLPQATNERLNYPTCSPTLRLKVHHLCHELIRTICKTYA